MKKVLLLLLFFGCMSKSQMSKFLSENPDIVMDVIKNNGSAFFEAVRVASEAFQTEEAERQRVESERSVQENFDNPFKPELSKERVLIGDDSAVIDLVEYSDFECPFCVRGFETVEDFLEKYKGKVRFTYKHFPLSNMHPNAEIAAKYFEAVFMQDKAKAYKFFQEIYKNQQNLVQNGETYLKQVVKTVGADAAKVANDIKSTVIQERLNKDLKETSDFGMSGTPGFLLNGIAIRGAYPLEHFDDIIKQLQEKGSLKL